MTILDVPSESPARLPTPTKDDPRLRRFSLNQKTTEGWPLRALVESCARHGVPSVGLWREPVAALGLQRATKLVADAGLRVSSLCRGGFLTADDDSANAALADNQRAIEEAATLGASCLVLVVGGLPRGSRDIVGARIRVVNALAQLAPRAAAAGVRLALEPMHPIYCADRGVISTLAQALDMAEHFDPSIVGVVVDSFHVWWDPELDTQLARAAGRIASFQVGDWITPIPPNALLARGMIGDGHIDFRRMRNAVENAAYEGDIEAEIFNDAVWAAAPESVLDTVLRRYVTHVLDPGATSKGTSYG